MLSLRSWVIGGDASCENIVDLPTVSSRHCRLMETLEGFVLEDLGSSNGTFVNGKRITAPTVVTQHDRITLGRTVPMPWPDLVSSAPSRTIAIGRSPDNDVVLDYPVVSSHHAKIVQTGERFCLEDLGSTNGTAVGSMQNRITRAAITRDDCVYFGSLKVPAARLLGEHLALGAEPYTQHKVAEKTVVVGRDSKCDIVLDDPLVSRRHMRLVHKLAEMSVEDLDSANGTFVNGTRIHGKLAVRPGDTVGVGSTTFTVAKDGELQQRDYRGNVTIEAHTLSIDVPQKRLVDGVSLTVYPSEFVGLMGPSGAGKTTLMNAMNGYTPPSEGSVLFNGRDLYANYGQFRNILGYVPQDDIMHGELTVGQALYYTARLRLPSDFSKEEIEARIMKVLGQLGLEGTEDVLIGSPQKKGISGGQRKRVNLAMELLTDPSVLFLDEPTSGLSSEDALMVMRVLRGLADDGKTIILTVHQPSLEAYRLLDNLILVGKDKGAPEPGRLVYYGPAYPQAVDFFNPDGVPDLAPGADPSPDEVLRGLAKRKTSEWVERYSRWPLKRQYVDNRAGKQPDPAARIPSPRKDRKMGLSQWRTLVGRCFSIKLKDRANTAILLAQAPIIALLIGLVFGKQASEKVTLENWPTVAGAVSTLIFLLALAALWFGCSNSAREIVGEWAIYHRERMVNLKIPSYVASKFTVLGGLCVVQCVVLLGIVYAIAGLKGPWLAMFAVLLLTALVGLAIGLTVSSLARTSEVAIALLPLILLPMVILAGVMQPIHEMNGGVQMLAQWMPSRWAFEGLLLLETAERPTWVAPTAENNKEQDMAEKFFPGETERMGTRASVIALGAMLIGFVVVIHGVLRWRDVH